MQRKRYDTASSCVFGEWTFRTLVIYDFRFSTEKEIHSLVFCVTTPGKAVDTKGFSEEHTVFICRV